MTLIDSAINHNEPGSLPGWRRGPSIFLLSLALLLSAVFIPASLVAKEEEEEATARIYRSPEERRDAGIGHEITDWIEIFSLIEFETEYEKETLGDGPKLKGIRQSSQSFQLGLDVEISDQLIAEIVYEYEFDRDQGQVDEAIIEYETDHWSLKIGRENISFGEFFSHFATGPLLEFGETRADALTLGYKFSPQLEVFGLVFKGDINALGHSHQTDFGGGLEFTADNESFVLGFNYLSDIAESDEQFLAEEGNRYFKRVSGFNAYLLWALERFEITAEVVKAMDRFMELEPEVDQPIAWNLELAWMPRPRWQLAFRVEGSAELEDEPERQLGLSSSWLLSKYAHLSLDYLYGDYKKGFAEDDNENELESRQSAAIQLSIEF